GGKVRVLKMLSIKYGIEWKKFERYLGRLLIKPKETFENELHHYDSDILCDFVQKIANYERGYGFYCISEYFKFIKKGLLEYFPSFKAIRKADGAGKYNLTVIEKVLDKKRVIEIAENRFKKRLMEGLL
ncbi:9354_t:CDS:2, partial [Gigaspora rosea]